jgi:hypothetical protein
MVFEGKKVKSQPPEFPGVIDMRAVMVVTGCRRGGLGARSLGILVDILINNWYY